MDLLRLDDPECARAFERLGPYARHALLCAARHARRLHAEELTVEHLLTAILGDEDAGATRLVLHAFADPETLAIEILALSPGIMVVGSSRSLPFSVRGVRALARARARAAGRAITPADVFAAALAELPPELVAALEQAGLRADALDPVPEPPSELARALFRDFSAEARRALGAACRVAARLERDAIAPAHLAIGTLETDPELSRLAGLGAQRARLALGAHDADPTPIEPLAIAPDAGLHALLVGVAAGADTTALFGWLLAHGSEELRLLLARQRITAELHARAGSAFHDPEPEDEAGERLPEPEPPRRSPARGPLPSS